MSTKQNKPSVSSSESCVQAGEGEPEHTPGPWGHRRMRPGNNPNYRELVAGENKGTVCILDCVREGDAKLIAAAPNLLQTVKECRAIAKKSVSPLHRLMAISDRLDKVLDKYEGEA